MEDTPFATCVVDASVLVKLLVPEVGSEQATALLANARGAGERAIPNLAWMECTNALWKCERREKLLADIARQCLADLLLLPLAVELALARGVRCDVRCAGDATGLSAGTADTALARKLAGSPARVWMLDGTSLSGDDRSATTFGV